MPGSEIKLIYTKEKGFFSTEESFVVNCIQMVNEAIILLIFLLMIVE